MPVNSSDLGPGEAEYQSTSPESTIIIVTREFPGFGREAEFYRVSRKPSWAHRRRIKSHFILRSNIHLFLFLLILKTSLLIIIIFVIDSFVRVLKNAVVSRPVTGCSVCRN